MKCRTVIVALACVLVTTFALTSTTLAQTPTATTTPSASIPGSSITDWIGVGIQAATLLAIIVGGAWTYRTFVRTRQKYPRATVTHLIQDKQIARDMVLLHLTEIIENRGEVLLPVPFVITRVQQVLPLPRQVIGELREARQASTEKTEIGWPWLHKFERQLTEERCELEPGESQQFHYDIVLGAHIRTVEIYTYVKNIAKPDCEIGWEYTTIYDLKATRRPSMMKRIRTRGRSKMSEHNENPVWIEKQRSPKPEPARIDPSKPNRTPSGGEEKQRGPKPEPKPISPPKK